MKLWELTCSNSAVIEAFTSDLPPSYQTRLLDLGFCPGEKVTCVRTTPFGGPRIYQVGDSVFSLAREIAREIDLSDLETTRG